MRQAQDVEDLGIEAGERPLGERVDDVIERALPAQRAGGDLSGERAIALVVQSGAGPRERRRQIHGFWREPVRRFPIAVDRPQRLVRRHAGGRDHGGLERDARLDAMARRGSRARSSPAGLRAGSRGRASAVPSPHEHHRARRAAGPDDRARIERRRLTAPVNAAPSAIRSSAADQQPATRPRRETTSGHG